MDNGKKCNRCLEWKYFTNFHKNSSSPDGYHSLCKNCKNQHAKNYYKENVEQYAQQHKNYYEQNKDKIIEKGKEYRIQNSEKEAERHRNYYMNNLEKIEQYAKNYAPR